ncbi:hypothetical protein [Algibacter aquimarinus]|uniref:Uncharacterized protein n=1 Tax=Algibacter aquimarinus TaxID=1136748 RepID=A0ABP9HMB3_9FLAO
MEEFLLNNYNLLTHSVEAMAALTGLLLFKFYKNTKAKYFIFFLAYLTICDFIGGYTKLVYPDKFFHFLIGTLIQKNYWFSTLYWKIGAIMFFAFYYRKILRIDSFKSIIKYTSYSFLIFSVIYVLIHWNAFFNSFFPIISVLGAIIVFLCTVFYFIEILLSDKILTFYKSVNFYISFAIFIWWLIITPIVFYDNYGAYEVGVSKKDFNYLRLRSIIYLLANIIMYSTFTFALIYCRPKLTND